MNLTLGQVQQRLYDVHQQLTLAQQHLEAARNKEVAATEALTMAKARAVLSEECPKPKRGENGITVGDRDAWVDRQVESERFAQAVCEATRQAAWDNLSVTQTQASLVQSLSGLMKAEMALTGVS